MIQGGFNSDLLRMSMEIMQREIEYEVFPRSLGRWRITGSDIVFLFWFSVALPLGTAVCAIRMPSIDASI